MKKLILFLTLLLCLFFAYQKVNAASALDLKIYPPVAYLSVKPGAGINHQIKISNDGLYTLEVTPVLVNFHSDEKTGLVVLEQKSDFLYLNLDGDPNKWGKSFLLKPGEEKLLNFVIALPSQEKLQEHHLSILFQAKQLSYSSIAHDNTMISAVVASNVVLLVSGDEQNRGELSIEQFFLPKIADSFIGFNFSALVRNIGSNATPIEGHIKISHWPDQTAELYELYPDMVLADGKRLVRAMSEDDLKALEKLVETKEVMEANGEDYEAKRTAFINEHLQSEFWYKKGFLIGAYDLELKVGDDLLQKRIVVLPFSVLGIAILLPLLYWLFMVLKNSLRKTVID